MRAVITDIFFQDYLTGWFTVPATPDNKYTENIEVILFLDNKIISKGELTSPRHDVTNSIYTGLGFKLKLPVEYKNLIISDRFRVEIRSCDISLIAQLSPKLEKIKSLFDINDKKELSERVRTVTNICNQLLAEDAQKIKFTSDYKYIANNKKRLAVVTYANTNEAWFNYFLAHYRENIPGVSIYVVTPNPALFIDYNLEGIISISGFDFCDIKRAKLMSDFQNGLRAYYSWIITCDVDELLFINPPNSMSVNEFLDTLHPGSYISWGVDIIQSYEDDKFCFNKSVKEQRRLGVLNTAISKPIISSADVNYAPGFHFSNTKPSFLDTPAFITLHMKWACSDVKKSLNEMFSSINCSNDKTKNYFLKTSNPNERHSILNRKPDILNFNSEKVKDFYTSYYNELRYTQIGYWVSDYRSSTWLVDISDLTLGQSSKSEKSH